MNERKKKKSCEKGSFFFSRMRFSRMRLAGNAFRGLRCHFFQEKGDAFVKLTQILQTQTI